jgi:hypothetical protein
MSEKCLSFKTESDDRAERNRRTLQAKDSFRESGSEY